MRDIVKKIGSKTEEGRLKIEKIERYENRAEYYNNEALASTIGSGVCIAITGLLASTFFMGESALGHILSWLLTISCGIATAFVIRSMVDDLSNRNINLDKAHTLEEEILELIEKEEKVK